MTEEHTTATEPGVSVVGEQITVPRRTGRRRIGRRLAAARDKVLPPQEAGTVTSGSGTGSPAVRRGAPARRPAPAPVWLVPMCLVITALSVVAAVGFAIAWQQRGQSLENSQDNVKRVASDFLLALTNFKPTTIDSDFRTISTYATGNFAEQSNQFFGSSIRQQLEQVQAESEGQIRYLYIQSLSGNQASVYAEVDQTYANHELTTARTDDLQVVLSMTDSSSGWKISAVTVLQPPSDTGTPTGNAAGS